jgi:PKD repeat protein
MVNLTVTNASGTNTSFQKGYVTILVQQVVPDFSPTNIYVANDAGVKYDYPDGTPVGTYQYVPNTYFLYFDTAGGGLNPVHLGTTNVFDTSSTGNNIYGTVATSRNQSGTFYVTFTGGQGSFADGILMLAVNGTIPDDFSVHIKSSGPTGGMEETFDKSDFIYGPQIYKPSSSAGYPIFYGQNMSDTGNTFQLMFIDLKSDAEYSATGFTTVDYSFNNLTTFAAFNVYGWQISDNHGTGIHMTNDVTASPGGAGGSSGYMVLGIPSAPVANFTSSTENADILSPVQFTDTSTNVPQSWLWEFGDGSTSTEQNPLHTYSAVGTYTVNLTATNLKGTDKMVKTGYITKSDSNPPGTAFSANVTSGVSPCPVQFTDQSTGTIISRSWDFGDGTTSTEQSPVHWYAPGTYTVNLTATNSAGSKSAVKTSYITVTPNGRYNQFMNPGFENGDLSGGWIAGTTAGYTQVSTAYIHTSSYSAKGYKTGSGVSQYVDLTNVTQISFWKYTDRK